MVSTDPVVIEAVNATSVADAQAIAKEIGIEFAAEHLTWCEYVWSKGARFAVFPGRLLGKGVGIVAARDIEAGEQIAYIPPELLYTTNCIPSAIKKKYPKSSVHGLLAAGLMHEMRQKHSPHKSWISTWPKLKDLRDSMPLLLEERYRKPLVDDKTSKKFLFLPPEIGGIWIDSLGNLETGYESTGSLPKQEVKMRRDITIVGANDSKNGALRNSRAAQEADLNWLWLIVNSRSFYYDLPLRTKPRNKDDKLCLCPFIDYFNHGNQGCKVAYNEQGFTITTDRNYEKGQEILISYGLHGNDLLWTDYGFLLDENNSDSICIDAWMLDPSTKIADPDNRRRLEDAGYWKNYVISRKGPCYRTMVAIQTQTLSSENWGQLVRGETISVTEDDISHDTRALLTAMVLKPCIATCKFVQAAIGAMESDIPSPMIHFALERWKQIQIFAENCS